MANMVAFEVRFSDALAERIRLLALVRGTSITGLVRLALERELAEGGDAEIRAANERWARHVPIATDSGC